MPAQALLLPIGCLAAGALLAGPFGRLSEGAGRTVAAVAAWAAVVAMLAVWLPQRSPLEQTFAELGAGIRLAVRVDAVSFAFGLYVTVPAALLLTFQRVRSPALGALATAAALLSVEASGLILAALAWGVTLTILRLYLQVAGAPADTAARVRNEATWLCLAWAATVLYALAGTDQYVAAPVTAVTPPLFGLVMLAALFASGLVPWRPWHAAALERLEPEAAGLPVALLFPFGFYLLVRLYQTGDGQYPSQWFNLGLAALGTLTALSAALRAQAAASRRGYFSEAVPLAGGFTLLALALGTPLGLATAIAEMAGAALLPALLVLIPAEVISGSALLALAIVAGLPPALPFASRLLTLQAAVQANEATAYLALLAALAWLLAIAGAARALRLGAKARGPGSLTGVGMAAFALLLAGPLVGALQQGLAIPAAASVLGDTGFPSSDLTGLPFAAASASGSWPGIALGGIVLLVTLTIVLAGRRTIVASLAAAPGETGSAPFLRPAWQTLPGTVFAWVDTLAVPGEFQVTGWRRIDQALTSGSVWLWVAVFLALALLLLR